jgi:citrate synthase
MIVGGSAFNLDGQNQRGDAMSTWLDRRAALARLNVRPQTLYAYVSRGRVAMRPDPDDPRRSLYSGADIDTLATRRARGRRPAAIAASAIAWGEPAVVTTISTVRHGRLVYRGADAVALSARATLEDVAALLWETEAPPLPPALSPRGRRLTTHRPRPAGSARAAAFATLAGLAACAPPTPGRPVTALRDDAAAAVAALARALGAAGGGAPTHARLARGWSLGRRATDAVRRALVLLADHELNASAFAARVAASTGAPLAACLLAGLSTLAGPRHGGAADAVAALAADAERLGSEAAVAQWSARGALPGFGHPLYPEGDPRAAALLANVSLDETLAALRAAVTAAGGPAPNVDFALLALVRALDLPPDAPFRLFALGRSVGWAAHAMEQAATGQLIRPRARYEGALAPASR